MKRILSFLRENIFMRNSIVLFFGMFFMNVLNYVFHSAVGRMVDAETYGSLQSLIALLIIVSVPAATLGMVATKYAAIAKARGDTKYGRHLFVYLNKRIIKYGGPLLVVGLLLTPFVQSFLNIDDRWAVILLWVLVALTFLSSISSGILTGWQKFGIFNLSGISGAGIKLLLGVAFAWFGWGLDSLMFGLVMAGFAGYFVTVWGLRFLKQKEKNDPVGPEETVSEEPFDFSSVRGYAITAFTGMLALVMLGNIDIVLAKHALSPELAGAYGALMIVAKVIFFATSVMGSVLFAMSSEAIEKNKESEKSFSVFWMALSFTIVAVATATTIYFLVPGFILSIFFGDKYLAVAPLLGWFGLAASLYTIVNLILQQLLSLHSVAAARLLLGIAVIETLGLFFFGSSLQSIVAIVIGIQALALVSGLMFIWKKCRI